jgi:hypothetical protein
MTAKRPLHVVVVVWGARYIDCFLSLALPSFLGEGNIPACAQSADVTFFVYTRPEDAEMLRESLARTHLQDSAAVTIDPLLVPGSFAGKNRYDCMAMCHAKAIERATAEGATLCVLSPDCIVSSGTLAHGLARLAEGYKAVLVAGPRATLDTMQPILERRHGCAHGSTATISSRELITLLSENPHPISQILFWDAPVFTAFPSAIYWHVGSKSILSKYFHLHPLLVDLAGAPEQAARCGTVDGALISMAKIPPEQIYVVTHSDEIAVVELSSLAHDGMGSVPRPTRSRMGRMISWTSRYADPTHRLQFARHDIRFQGDEDVDWPRAVQAAHRQIRPLLLAIRLMESFPKMTAALERWRRVAETIASRLYFALQPSRR